MKRSVQILGAAAIIVASFVATDLLITWWLTPLTPDQQRASHVNAVKSGLEAYRKAKGQYPAPYGDNQLSDLKKELVDGKFIDAIPKDPTGGEYRYVSGNGKSYGLLIQMDGGICMTGVGAKGSGWWNNAPDCPF
jgi:hypothetical protein